MIVYDDPYPADVCGQPQMCSRLASTLRDQAGTLELTTFAQRIDLHERLLVDRGQPTEHFQLIGYRWIDTVRTAGAGHLTRGELNGHMTRKQRIRRRRGEGR